MTEQGRAGIPNDAALTPLIRAVSTGDKPRKDRHASRSRTSSTSNVPAKAPHRKHFCIDGQAGHADPPARVNWVGRGAISVKESERANAGSLAEYVSSPRPALASSATGAVPRGSSVDPWAGVRRATDRARPGVAEAKGKRQSAGSDAALRRDEPRRGTDGGRADQRHRRPPQGVQVIGGPYREDLCLDAAAAIEERLGTITPTDPRS